MRWVLRIGGDNRRIPIEKPIAAIADEQLSLTQLVPDLGTNPHLAAIALLSLGACQAGSAASRDAIKANEYVRINRGAQSIPFGIKGGLVGAVLGDAELEARFGLFERVGERFHTLASCGQQCLLGVGALQADESLILQTRYLLLSKVELMFHGGGLRGIGHGVQLRTKMCGLLLVSGNLTVKLGPLRILTIQSTGGLGHLLMSGLESGLGLRHLERQSLGLGCQTPSLQLHGL